jgi:hypothetical protein
MLGEKRWEDMNWFHLAGFLERGNEPSISLKDGEFVD